MISPDGSEAIWTFAQEFTSSFQVSCSDLASRFKTTSADSVLSVARDIQALNKRLLEATGRLPSYDQRRCELQLTALENSLEELRSSTAGKTKFAFKRRAKTPSSASTESATTTAPAITPTITAATIHSPSRTISNLSNCYISRSCLSGTNSPTPDRIEVSIINISNGIVNLLPIKDESTLTPKTVSLSALHIRDVQNSILILGTIHGSIMLHEITNCVVVAGCHQFRMHNSIAVDAYLDIASNPIIENCAHVRFGAYPGNFESAIVQQPLVTSGCTNLPFLPQDFSHIRATPSPNWKALEEHELLHNWPIVEKGYTVKLDKALPRPTT